MLWPMGLNRLVSQLAGQSSRYVWKNDVQSNNDNIKISNPFPYLSRGGKQHTRVAPLYVQSIPHCLVGTGTSYIVPDQSPRLPLLSLVILCLVARPAGGVCMWLPPQCGCEPGVLCTYVEVWPPRPPSYP